MTIAFMLKLGSSQRRLAVIVNGDRHRRDDIILSSGFRHLKSSFRTIAAAVHYISGDLDV